MAKVSIILPSLNVIDYVEECLNSVVNQTLKDIEIICVDAGSTDGTLEVIQKFAEQDKRIIVLQSDKKSYGYQMNIGIERATGKYIGIVETDDLVPENMYEELFEKAEEHQLEILKADFYRFTTNEDKTLNLYLNKLNKDGIYYNCVLAPRKHPEIFSFIMNTWTGIYLKSFLEKHHIRHNETPGASFQDTDFWFQTLSLADKAMFIDKPYYRNRRDNPNSSVYNPAKVYALKDEYDYLHNFLEKNSTLKQEILPVYQFYRYKAYMSSLNRCADDEQRLAFLKTFAEDFKQTQKDGELDLSAFTQGAKETIALIMENPEKFLGKYKKQHDKKKITYNLGTLQTEHTRTHQESDGYKVSVIIPVYNAETYLEECLDSVLSQTLKDIEVICIDDGSWDNSLSILDYYAKKDSRIVIRRQDNSGSGAARNFAMNIAVGEFIAFMDADDYYPENDILETLYNKAIQNKVKICGGSFSNVKDGKVTTKFFGEYAKYTFKEEKLMRFDAYQFDYGYHRFIYRRKLLDEHQIRFPNHRRFQDPVFFLNAMVLAEQFYAVPKVVYRYRKDNNKVTWDAEKVQGLLGGILDNLKISKENRLAHIHRLNVDHLNNEFCDVVVQFANEKKIFELLFDITYNIDKNLLIEEGFNISAEEMYFIKPLRKIIFSPKLASANLNIVDLSGHSHRFSLDLNQLKLSSNIIANREEVPALLKKIEQIKKSRSYKIGRAITYVPRKIKQMLK